MSTYSKLNRPIHVVAYDPTWPLLYEEEKRRLCVVLGERVVQIEHIGSTAIPGLTAKPVIDIAIGIRQLAQAPECITILRRLGYMYVPELEVALPERRFLWAERTAEQRYHLHVTEPHGPIWEQPLAFRDYLRTHPDAAAMYGRLKSTLAVQAGSDIGAYVQGKTEFVHQILAKAMGAIGQTAQRAS